MVKFEGTNYLLCALGDGSLFYFVLNVDAVAAAGIEPLRHFNTFMHKKMSESTERERFGLKKYVLKMKVFFCTNSMRKPHN